MPRNRWLIVIIALLVGWQLWTHRAPESVVVTTTPGQSQQPTSVAFPTAAPVEPTTRNADPAPEGLPPEAVATLQLIRDGGPFPYDRDGIVFGNFEGRLPKQTRGYYHEYTVPTPGVNHRGARRIISGGKPPSEFYYTDDHYESFRKIGGAR